MGLQHLFRCLTYNQLIIFFTMGLEMVNDKVFAAEIFKMDRFSVSQQPLFINSLL